MIVGEIAKRLAEFLISNEIAIVDISKQSYHCEGGFLSEVCRLMQQKDNERNRKTWFFRFKRNIRNCTKAVEAEYKVSVYEGSVEACRQPWVGAKRALVPRPLSKLSTCLRHQYKGRNTEF